MPVSASLVPKSTQLPLVFPTGVFGGNGMYLGAKRSEMRRVSNVRNFLTLISAWLQTFAMLVGCNYIVNHTHIWPLWIIAFILMGRGHGLFGILGHEAAHRLMFSRKSVNDFAGLWFLNAPTFISQMAYRRSHMAHHRDALGESEPDLTLYKPYPAAPRVFMRRLRRDVTGESGYKLTKALLASATRKVSRRAFCEIVLTQLAIGFALGYLIGWWAWPVLWFGPWLTIWRVLNRLRAVAEHGAMVASQDERQVTHHIVQSPLARFWIVPFNTGYHVAHHLDAGVPFRNLGTYTRELTQAGYFTPEITFPSYVALWRTLVGR